MVQLRKSLHLKFPLDFMSTIVSIIPDIKKALPFEWATIIPNKDTGEAHLLMELKKSLSLSKVGSVFFSLLNPLGVPHELVGVSSIMSSLYFTIVGANWPIRELEVFGSLQSKKDLVDLLNRSSFRKKNKVFYLILQMFGVYGIKKAVVINSIKRHGSPLPSVKYIFGGYPLSFSSSSLLLGVCFGINRGHPLCLEGNFYYVDVGVDKRVCREEFGHIIDMHGCHDWDIKFISSLGPLVKEVCESCEPWSLFHSDGFLNIGNTLVEGNYPYEKYLKRLKDSGKEPNQFL